MRKALVNPSYVLWVIRQGRGSTWESLCRSVGMAPDDRYTLFGGLMGALETLSKAKLISTNHPLDKESVDTLTFAVTPLLRTMQQAFEVSLSQLAATAPDYRLIVEPAIHRTSRSRFRSDILVLMPFLPELRPVYDDHIKSVALKLGMSAARADDFFTAGHIVEEIWTAIVSAKLIIADCTGRNPNVFYEIGLAHAIGKPVILITRDQEDVPFDLRHRRYIRYEFTPRGMRDFEEALNKTIMTLQNEGEVT
jgi:hypothetical protein